MALLDNGFLNTLFGATGSPDAQQQPDLSELLKQLQMMAGYQPQNNTSQFFPGGVVEGFPYAQSNQATKTDKAAKGDASAAGPQTAAPSIDSRYLEQTNPTSTTYQQFSPWTTTIEPNNPPAPPMERPGVKFDEAPMLSAGYANNDTEGQTAELKPPSSANPRALPGSAAAGAKQPQTTSPAAPPQNGGPQTGGPVPPQTIPPTRQPGITPPSFAPSFGGILSAFGNALTGKETTDFSQLAAQRNATYQALIAQGASPQLAEAAVLNPKILDQVSAKMFPNYQATGQGVFGQPEYNWVNPLTQTVGGGNVLPGTGGNKTTLGTKDNPFPKIMGDDGQPLRGNEYIDATGAPLPIAEKAKNILAGREQLPAATKGDPTALQVQALVRAADDGYNANRWGYRQGWEKATTIAGKTRVANNTAIQHLFALSGLVDDAPDSNAGYLSNTSTRFQAWSMKQHNDPWLGKWESNADVLAGEIAKVNKGGEPSLHEIEAVKKTLDPANGQARLKGTITRYIELMNGKTVSLANDWKKQMGPYAEQPQVIDDENAEHLAEMNRTMGVNGRYSAEDAKLGGNGDLGLTPGSTQPKTQAPGAPKGETAPRPALRTPQPAPAPAGPAPSTAGAPPAGAGPTQPVQGAPTQAAPVVDQRGLPSTIPQNAIQWRDPQTGEVTYLIRNPRQPNPNAPDAYLKAQPDQVRQ